MQSVLCILGFCICGFNQPWIKILQEKNYICAILVWASFLVLLPKQHNIASTDSVYILLGLISNLEVSSNVQEDAYRLNGSIQHLILRTSVCEDLSIHGNPGTTPKVWGKAPVSKPALPEGLPVAVPPGESRFSPHVKWASIILKLNLVEFVKKKRNFPMISYR